MYLGLLGLGVLVTAAGASMIGFGIPINAFSFGNTLIVGGTTALIGGLILIAIAAAVRQLRRIADALGRQAVAPLARPAEVAGEGAAVPASVAPAAAASAAAQPANAGRIPYPPKPRPASPRVPGAPIGELTPKPASGPAASPSPGRDLQFDPRPAAQAGSELSPKPVGERPGRDLRLDPRIAAMREPSAKPSESTGPELRPEPRVSAPAIDASDDLIPRERRPTAEGPRRPGEPPPVVPEPEEVSLSPRTSSSAPPPPRPALSLPPSIAEVFGSKWSQSLPDDTVVAEPPAAPRPDTRHDARPASPPQSPPGSFDSLWPADPVANRPKAEGADAPAKLEAPRAEEMMTGHDKRDAQPSAILKSGVIDGMAYTLYTDGSITADLPQGTMRFASVEALRAHLDKAS